jgi:ubiquinone/menaquinone biosynthesis C-methylase UbiE
MPATPQPIVRGGLNEIFSWPKEKIASDLHPDFVRYFGYHLDRGNIDPPYQEMAHYVAESGLCGHVLDFGCGFGVASLCMRALGIAEVTGADLVPAKYETARKLASFAGCDNVHFVESDDNLTFNDACFDGILIKDALSHLYEDSSFLGHAWRVLIPGGILLIVDDRNSLSPMTVYRTRKMWELSEKGAPEQTVKIGISRNYAQQRLDFLERRFPEMSAERRQKIAASCRGYNNQQIELWLTGGSLESKHAPCVVPGGGAAQERLINPLKLKRRLEQLGFQCRVGPGFNQTAWKRAILQRAWPASLFYSGSFHVVARKPESRPLSSGPR